MGELIDITEQIWTRQIHHAWDQNLSAWAPEAVDMVAWRSLARQLGRQRGRSVRTFIIPIPDGRPQAGATLLTAGTRNARAAHPAGRGRPRS